MIMDYEKLHKDTITRLHQMVNSGKITVETACSICADFVPESEDERIRKELIDYFSASHATDTFRGIPWDRVAAWLEKQGEHANFRNKIQIGDKVTRNEDGVLVNLSRLKRVAKKDEKQGEQILANSAKTCKDEQKPVEPQQDMLSQEKYAKAVDECIYGEQKPADKVEPKFKIGDWVVFNNKHQSIYQVEKIEDGYYILRHTHGGTFRVCVLHNESLRLWTIQDAKDGDVLAVTMYPEGTWIGIFKEQNGCTFSSHCFVNTEGTFKLGTYNHGNGKAIHPATKEQRGQLEKAMANAGYTFDFEKKELKKIEQKPAESINDVYPETLDKAIDLYYHSYGNGNGYFENLSFEKFKDIVKTFVSDYSKQKPAWSEEDEQYIIDTINLLSFGCSSHSVGEVKDFLKSLKDRVQPKQEWSKEDEQMLNDIIKDLVHPWNEYIPDRIEDEIIWLKNRLKSLRPQNRWKPSDEQMNALNYVVNLMASSERPTENDLYYNILKSLRQQLMKLKE